MDNANHSTTSVQVPPAEPRPRGVGELKQLLGSIHISDITTGEIPGSGATAFDVDPSTAGRLAWKPEFDAESKGGAVRVSVTRAESEALILEGATARR
jgi:hypothetical protein